MNFKSIIPVLIISIALFSCKKNEDNDALKEEDFFNKNGFINVKVEGLSKDSISLNESFSAEYFEPSYYDGPRDSPVNDSVKVFELERVDGIGFFSNQVSLNLIKKGNKVELNRISLQVVKVLNPGDILIFNLENYQKKSSEITNFVYNEVTGNISGGFSSTFEYSKYPNTPHKVVVSGDFNLDIEKVFHK